MRKLALIGGTKKFYDFLKTAGADVEKREDVRQVLLDETLGRHDSVARL